MAAGTIKRGYIKNRLEEMMMGRVGKLTRRDLKNVPLAGSDYPIVYICSPFAAYGSNTVQTNIAEAKRYCRYAIGQKKQPLCVHLLYPQFLDDRKKREREMGLSFGISLLRNCDIEAVWVFKRRDGKVSSGMAKEISEAKKLHIPVIYVNDPKAFGMYGWNPIKAHSENHGKEGSDVSSDGHGHGKSGSELGECDHSAGCD